MRRSTRAAVSRVRWHLTGALAASVVGASVAVVFSGDPVSANAHAAKTVTVSFTDRGPTPESVQLRSGDSVTFVNRLSRSGKVRVARGVLAEVASASVRVHGAATTDFLLAGAGGSRTLTYTGPQTVRYTATYTFTLRPVLNVLGDNLAPLTTTVSTSGQLIVAAPLVSRTKRSGRHSQPPPSSPSGGAAQQPGTGGGPAGGVGSSTGQSAAPAKRPGVVAAQVPHSWAGIGPPPAVLGSTDRGALQLPHLPQLATNGDSGAGTSTGKAPRTAGLDLPAIVAVALLSVVTAALVRSLIIQRRSSHL
jgi:plastocyanin